MDKLLPCPFCGSEAIIVDEWLCTCGFKYCDMNASLMSITAWNTRHTPEGWQLVPVEATDEMLGEIHLMETFTVRALRARYDAMLAAAPKWGGE